MEKNKWKKVFNIDFEKIILEENNCKGEEEYLCVWVKAPLEKIKDGYDLNDSNFNKENILKLIRYCEDEIENLKQNIEFKKKYKNIYHQNTWISDLLQEKTFKLINDRLKKNL